jgi:hypothetical protein
MVMWWWALAYGDGGVSLLRWCLVVLFAVEMVDLDVCLLPCNSFLGGGSGLLLTSIFWWWLMVLAGLLQFEIFFLRQNSIDAFLSSFSPAAMQSDRKCRPFAYTRGFRRSP